MLEPTLVQAAEAFAATMRTIGDAAFERDWLWRGVVADVRWGCYRTYEELRDLAVRIAGERIAAGSPPTAAQRTLAQYEIAYRDLQALLLDATEDDVDRAPAQGEWPLRDALGHMLRAERGFLGVTTYALARHRSGGAGPAQAPDQWLAQYDVEGGAQGTLAEIMARYDAMHARVIEQLAPLPDAELATPVSWWYEADVRFQYLRFDAHLREHTIQVEKVLEAIRPRPGDGQRTARLVYQALGEAEGAAIGAPGVLAERCHGLATEIEARRQALAAITAA